MAEEHRIQLEKDIDREKLRTTFEDAKIPVDTIGFIMSKNEVVHINE